MLPYYIARYTKEPRIHGAFFWIVSVDSGHCRGEGLGGDLIRDAGILHAIKRVGINSREVLIESLYEGRELGSH